MLILVPEVSRRDTVRARSVYLEQLPISAQPGSRAWVRQTLALRVVERKADVALVNDIWMNRHYLGCQPAGPRMKRMSILGDLAGVVPGPAGCAVAVTVALQPTKSRVFQALRAGLELHPCNVIELTRCWRSDDLGPDIVPDLMPFVLRRIVKGGNGLRPLAEEWNARKLTGGLSAPARLLLTYADGEVGHDGGLYLGAGAVPVGRTQNGKLAFAWALDGSLRAELAAYGRAVAEKGII